MKPICKPFATALAALLAIPLLAAPRPLAWRADFPSARVENFPVRHGTDVEFRPAWYVNGSPADTNGWTYSLSVQTNGAPAGEWATISGTVFSHTNDCGAEAYNVLVRAVDSDGTVDYSAAARLRMLPSPGFEPGALPPAATFQESDPVFSAWLSAFQELDPVFSAWLATFEIPETSLEPATNYTARSLESFAATGTVARASSYGTPTRWTDSTGCVWEASMLMDRWLAADIGLSQDVAPEWYGPEWVDEPDDFYIDRNGWWVSSQNLTPEFLGDNPNSTMLDLIWYYYDGMGSIPVHTTFRRPVVTNLVGRVALTNDVTDAIREHSLGGIWDGEVWWTPVMLPGGCLTYQATTNVNMEANQ